MHIRFDMHRAVICTALDEKLRIPLTKNEQWRGARLALLATLRCYASHPRFRHTKTLPTRCVPTRDAETSMAQGFSHSHAALHCRTDRHRARNFFSASDA